MAAQSPKCFIIRTENIKLHSWTLIILIIIIILLQKSQIQLNIRMYIKLKSHESCYLCLTYNSLLYYVFYCTYNI